MRTKTGMTALLSLALGLLAPRPASALTIWPDPTIGVTHIMNGDQCLAHEPLAICLVDGWCLCECQAYPNCECPKANKPEVQPPPKGKKAKDVKPKKADNSSVSMDALAITYCEGCPCGDPAPDKACFQFGSSKKDKAKQAKDPPKPPKKVELPTTSNTSTAFLMDDLICNYLYGQWGCRRIEEIDRLHEEHRLKEAAKKRVKKA